MNQNKCITRRLAVLAGLLVATTMAAAAPPAEVKREGAISGEKVDSGLGELPHYREWKNAFAGATPASQQVAVHIPGEKIDSGLGDLPDYRKPQTAMVTTKPVSIATR